MALQRIDAAQPHHIGNVRLDIHDVRDGRLLVLLFGQDYSGDQIQNILDAVDGLVGQEGPGGIVAAVEYISIVPGQTRPEQDQQAAAVEFRRRSMVQLDETLKGMRALRSDLPGQDDEGDQDSAEKAAAKAASTASSAR